MGERADVLTSGHCPFYTLDSLSGRRDMCCHVDQQSVLGEGLDPLLNVSLFCGSISVCFDEDLFFLLITYIKLFVCLDQIRLFVDDEHVFFLFFFFFLNKQKKSVFLEPF